MVTPVLHVSLALDPWSASTNRARRAARTKSGKPYSYAASKPARFRAALAAATRAAVREQGVSFPSGAVAITMLFEHGTRCRRPGAPPWLPHGDVDSPEKVCLDGLVDGRALSNDVFVGRLLLEKRVGPPRVTITITGMADPPDHEHIAVDSA